MPTIADILAGIDSVVTPAKRRLADMIRNPLASAQQTVGLLGDRAQEFDRDIGLGVDRRALQNAGSVMAGAPQYVDADRRTVDRMNSLIGSFAPIGLTVYHGSPHKFDRFDSSKIGTGEGAQAYGHGIYVAEKPETAAYYKTSQAPVGARGDAGRIAMNWMQEAQDAGLTGSAASKWAKEQIYKRAQETQSQQVRQSMYDAMNNFDDLIGGKYGNLYKADLPDDQIAKMLDWDKPLSQQNGLLGKLLDDVENVGAISAQKIRDLATSPGLADWAKRDLLKDAAQVEKSKSPQHVAGVLKRMQLEYGINPDNGPFKEKAGDFLSFVKGMQAVPNMDTGGGAVSYLNARYGEKQAAEMMRQAGIPGIRYLDGGSRGAGTGTQNFVVFPGNEGLLKILERNGEPVK